MGYLQEELKYGHHDPHMVQMKEMDQDQQCKKRENPLSSRRNIQL
jgi:hypothetical protein